MPRARNPENAGIFVPGQLSYLPKRRYSDLFSPTDAEVPAGCYDHPVLIVSTDQRKKEAVVLILTSLGGKTLDETSLPSRIRAFHLPIHPSPAHPDNGILLSLDQGRKLPKKTYVKTEKTFSIQWKLLQADYGDYRTGRRYKLKPDSFAELLLYIKVPGSPVGQGKTKLPEIPRPHSLDLQAMFDRIESMTASNFSPTSSTSSTSRPTTPPPQTPKPPKYTIQAPVTATTPQSVARSREGVAAATDRYLAQWRGGQLHESPRHETRSILPTYRNSPPSDPAVSPHNPLLILRRMFLVLLTMAGIFLVIAWWRCQLWRCK